MLMMFMITPFKKLSVNVLLLFDVKCTMIMDMNTTIMPGLNIEELLLLSVIFMTQRTFHKSAKTD